MVLAILHYCARLVLCGFFLYLNGFTNSGKCKNALVQGMDWKLKKKQPMSKEKLWNNFRKPGELLLTLKYYMEVWLLGSKRKEQETFAQCCKFSLIISFLYFRNNKVLLLRFFYYYLHVRYVFVLFVFSLPVFLYIASYK